MRTPRPASASLAAAAAAVLSCRTVQALSAAPSPLIQWRRRCLRMSGLRAAARAASGPPPTFCRGRTPGATFTPCSRQTPSPRWVPVLPVTPVPVAAVAGLGVRGVGKADMLLNACSWLKWWMGVSGLYLLMCAPPAGGAAAGVGVGEQLAGGPRACHRRGWLGFCTRSAPGHQLSPCALLARCYCTAMGLRLTPSMLTARSF